MTFDSSICSSYVHLVLTLTPSFPKYFLWFLEFRIIMLNGEIALNTQINLGIIKKVI